MSRQAANDTATGIRTRNFTTGTERWLNTLPQFGSPAQVCGPRNIRFNAAFRF